MTRKQLKFARDGEILVDYIMTSCKFAVNQNLGRGTKALGEHLKDLENEIIKRDILTQEEVDYLNR